MPQTAHPRRTNQTDTTAPATISPSPKTAHPMTIERRRLYASATTPVGTSKRNTASSMIVPTSTSSNGFMPTSRTK